MTKFQAHREAYQRWATSGIASTDRVAMVTLRRKNIVNRCEVGWYLRGDCVPVIAGSGPTWEAAFADADARTNQERVKLTADTITDAQILALQAALLAEGGAGSEDVASCSYALPGSTRWEPIADWGETRPVPVAERRAARARCAELLNSRSA